MRDCELCKSFKWEKEKAKLSCKVFDVPKCLLRKIEIKDPKLANNCADFDYR